MPDRERRVRPAEPPSSAPVRGRYDVVVVGGGHNGLTAAAYTARAGRSVLLLEAADHLGGATVSDRVFPGVDAHLSRYSYLVSLVPAAVRRELELDLTLRRRRISSYTPLPEDPSRGLLVDTADQAATAASFGQVGAAEDHAAWAELGRRTAELARAVFPGVTEPLPTAAQVRERIGRRWWTDLVERPLGEMVERTFRSDLVRGVVLTDGLIGTFARAHDTSHAQNRCFLYHVIGGGTGDWDVPVGGMGAVVGALERAARAAGADLRTHSPVTEVVPGPSGVAVRWTEAEGREREVLADHVLAACSPDELQRLRASDSAGPAGEQPEGAQLKVNMVLDRLPRLADRTVAPEAAFAGTFHVHEGYAALEVAYQQAAAGRIPDVPPLEIYCHTLTDPTILGPELRRRGAHTLTLFGLHMPARLFRTDVDGASGARERALRATLASLDSVLAEPVESCLATDDEGRPCLEVRTPVDLAQDVRLPGGHIFHGDLAWPWLPDGATALPGTESAHRWGVATDHPRVLLCGAGAVRGGGVSGIPGRSAAMAVLGR